MHLIALTPCTLASHGLACEPSQVRTQAVELKGLEPLTCRQRRPLSQSLSQLTKNRGRLVELRGLEPLTSALRTLRSPS